MKRNFSIHSPQDAEILDRFMKVLEEKGYNQEDRYDKIWNSEHNPLREEEYKREAQEEGRAVWYYTIDVFPEIKSAIYANHDGCGVGINLTPENFEETLARMFAGEEE